MIELQDAIAGLSAAEQAAVIAEFACHELEIARMRKDGSSHRGIVVPLTQKQRVNRALYLAGEKTLADLDEYVQQDGAPQTCPDIYYLLKDHNGGKNPCATDPADRWHADGKTFTNVTCDCIGGASWIGGWDRYQPVRFAHFYGGWINTDSMLMDARGPQKCFKTLTQPEPGCYVVCASGSPGHVVGHIGTIVDVPPMFDITALSSWLKLGVIDVAARTPHRANTRTTARGWFYAHSSFVVPIMN